MVTAGEHAGEISQLYYHLHRFHENAMHKFFLVKFTDKSNFWLILQIMAVKIGSQYK